MIWVINSNSNTYRIYEYNKRQSKLNLLKEIQHPENKLHNIDIVSDRSGRYKSNGGAHGAYASPSDPKEVKYDDFMRELARELNQERNKNSYEKLIIIAPAHVNGLLMQHIDKHVKELIICNLNKDLMHMADHELLSILESTPNY